MSRALTPWTKLEDSDLWRAAETAYDFPRGRTYHGFAHVGVLYAHAERLGINYHPALDLGILAHDAIQTGTDPEFASAVWLSERRELPDVLLPLLPQATQMILTTRKHHPGPCGNELIILDLADFIDPVVSRQNTAALRLEAAALKGWSEPEFRVKTCAYLAGLGESLDDGMPSVRSARDRELLGEIRAGVERVRIEVDRAAEPEFS